MNIITYFIWIARCKLGRELWFNQTSIHFLLSVTHTEEILIFCWPIDMNRCADCLICIVLSQTCRFITADLCIWVSRFSANCWPRAAVSSWLNTGRYILHDTHISTGFHCISLSSLQRPHRVDIVRTSVCLIWLLLLFTSNIREDHKTAG